MSSVATIKANNRWVVLENLHTMERLKRELLQDIREVLKKTNTLDMVLLHQLYELSQEYKKIKATTERYL